MWSLATIACLFWLQSCKTADGKLTAFGKFHHNLNGRYNAYYHADMRLTKANDQIKTAYKDNYNDLLTMYPYAANRDTNTAKTLLDEAIKKLATNIELHRPSNWADDSYFLLGKVEFYKNKYEKAAATFLYIIDKYNPNKPKSAMDKDELEKLKANQKKANKSKAKKSKKKKAPKKRRPTKRKKKRSSSSKSKSSAANKSTTKPTTGATTNTTKPSPTTTTTTTDKNPDPDKNAADDENEEKPDRYFLKHRPIRYDAMLWYAKACVELRQFDDAGLYLRLLENDGKTPYRLRSEVQAVTAYLWLAQKEYAKAIEPLEKAIKTCKRKKVKARYLYVLGQLYEKQNNFDLAAESYSRVIRSRPTFEMEFNARLSAARAAGRSTNSGTDPEFALRKMLRDGKNEEYKDQLYFALAEVQLRNGNRKDGIENLQKSLSSNQGGNQRVEACALLAELYYEEKQYVKSFAYYDSTMQAMKQEDDRYNHIASRKRQLELLATSTIAYELQDSLLRLSMLTFEEQKEFVKRLQKQQLEAAKTAGAAAPKVPAPVAPRALSLREKGQAGSMSMRKDGGNDQAAPRPNGASNSTTAAGIIDAAVQSSNFALYNPTLQKKGEKEFEKRWGTRPYADNWRRSKRAGGAGEGNTQAEAEALQPMTEDDIKAFLAQMGVPQDESQRAETEQKIAQALFGIGLAYREHLNMPAQSIATFERLVERFPKSKQAQEAWYMLYNLYMEQGNAAKAEACKKRILADYPNSDIAKAVQDPSFVNAKQQKEKELNKYYQQTYDMVYKGQFQQAMQRISDMSKLFGEEHTFKPRFALLAAMCEGGTKGEQDYIKALKVVSTSYPNTPEEKKAKEMIATLTKNGSATNTGGSNTNTANYTPTTAANFAANMNTGHYVLVVFDDKKVQVGNYIPTITEFNKTGYDALKLNVSSFMADNNTTPAITVRKFRDAAQALEYANQARNTPTFLGTNAPNNRVLVIGQDNYRSLLQTQQAGVLADYIKFHDATYK